MQSGNSRILFVLDLTAMFVFFFAVFTHYHEVTTIPLKGNILMGLIVIFWFLISVNSEVLRINSRSTLIRVTKDILIAYSVLSTVTIATVAIFGEFRLNDKLILYPMLFAFMFSLSTRLLYFAIVRHLVKYGFFRKSVLLIGSGKLAKHVLSKFLSSPELGVHIKGILSDNDLPPGKLNLGRLDQFQAIVQRYPIDEVIIAEPPHRTDAIRRIVNQCENNGIRFYIVPDYQDIIPQWTVLNNLGDIPIIAVRNEPLSIFSNRIIKRIFDIIFSIVGLLLLSPMLLIAALAIKLSSPGPVFFVQKRIGSNNIEFTLFKFRSMVVQPEYVSNTTWTIPDDQRITPVGRILRKTNLDELPQLWNVLVGDMSIVGPRPEREHYVEKFSTEIYNYRIRHRVKSGITGLAQAKGWRGNTSIQKRIENDLYYLENWSLWLDLKIIFLTFFSHAAWKNAI